MKNIIKLLVRECEYCHKWKWFFQVKTGLYIVKHGNKMNGCLAETRLCKKCHKDLVKEKRVKKGRMNRL